MNKKRKENSTTEVLEVYESLSGSDKNKFMVFARWLYAKSFHTPPKKFHWVIPSKRLKDDTTEIT